MSWFSAPLMQSFEPLVELANTVESCCCNISLGIGPSFFRSDKSLRSGVQALVKGAVSSLERQEAPELSEVPEELEVVPELPEVLPELPELVPELPEVVLGWPEPVPELLEVVPELPESQVGGVGTLAMSWSTDEMWPWADRYQAATVPLAPFPFVVLLCAVPLGVPPFS
jgi:hypothetical protein